MEEQSLCLICHDFIDTENNYTLPECKHKYHTKCIIEWFKRGDNRCPYCQNRGINNVGNINGYNDVYPYNSSIKIYFSAHWGDLKWWCEETKQKYKIGVQKLKNIEKYVKENNKPNWLVSEFKSLKKLEKRYKEFMQKKKDFYKIMNTLPYNESCKKKSTLQKNSFKILRKICSIKNNILTFPYNSIIIPITN
jgi:hypothetical protein